MSGGVWISFLPTALTAILGVVALPSGLSDQQFFGLLLFAVLASVIVWWNGAMQAQRADQDRQVVNDLLARLSADTQPISVAVAADLRGLSSAQLRQKVDDIAQRMRGMEQSFSTARHSVLHGPVQGDRNAYTAQLIAQSDQQTQQWRAEGQPVAVALWKELLRRIYGAPPYPSDYRADVALEYGMLSGVAPLSNAALVLEELARQLP